MGISKWSQTAGDNTNAKAGINWDENMAPSAVNDSARSTLAAVREWYDDAEWIKLGENGSANAFSISYVSATVFKFTSTDRRTLVPVGRRVKAGVGAGLIYGTVSDVTLSASDTQVTVSFDSGSLDSSLSYVSLGILNASNNSLPRGVNVSLSDVTVNQLTGASGILSSALSATGTSVSFTPIPSWAKKIDIQFVGISTNGTDDLLVQIGDSGGVETTGYLGSSAVVQNAAATSASQFTSGFGIGSASAANIVHGHMTLTLENASTNTWVSSHYLGRSNSATAVFGGGAKSLTGTLTTVNITTSGGTNTFDAGEFNIRYA